MKQKAVIALGILFVILLITNLSASKSSTSAIYEATPTHDFKLGTRSPEDAERGFPSPVPMILPVDLAPDRLISEKYTLVFRDKEGGLIAFLAPYEIIESQVHKIGVDFLEGIYPPRMNQPNGVDPEWEAIQAANATITPFVTIVAVTPMPSNVP